VLGDLDHPHLREVRPRAGVQSPAEIDDVHQPALEPFDVPAGIVDHRAVGGEHEVGILAVERPDRLDGERNALHVAVLVLELVELVEPAALVDQIAREGHATAVDTDEKRAGPERVALRRQHLERVVAPLEGLVVLERGVDRDALGERVERRAVVVVVVDALSLPERLDVVEQVALVLGDGNPRAGLGQPPGAPALVAVVVGVQRPRDVVDDRLQGLQDHSRSRIDHQRRVAVDDGVGVAGVRVGIEVLGERDEAVGVGERVRHGSHAGMGGVSSTAGARRPRCPQATVAGPGQHL
jgi:hypothetical protein